MNIYVFTSMTGTTGGSDCCKKWSRNSTKLYVGIPPAFLSSILQTLEDVNYEKKECKRTTREKNSKYQPPSAWAWSCLQDGRKDGYFILVSLLVRKSKIKKILYDIYMVINLYENYMVAWIDYQDSPKFIQL